MRIGADHGAVEATGRTFDMTGEVAQLTGSQATGYSAEMAAGVDEITTRLKSDFAATATQLTERVAAHARQLEATDWAGSSKEQALATEQALTVQVQQVLHQANEAVDQFGLQLHQRAETFRDAIEGGFLAAMREADQAYKEMAQASRTFLSNLQAADQTIRFGG
jgi:exonuclease VII large subunit